MRPTWLHIFRPDGESIVLARDQTVADEKVLSGFSCTGVEYHSRLGRTMMPKTPTPDSQMLADLVRRIIEVVQPTRIILFGSAARGEMGPNSDLDVLVVVPDGTHTGRAESAIYRNMWGFGFAADVLAVTEQDVRKHASNPYLIIHTALAHGKELYCAAG